MRNIIFWVAAFVAMVCGAYMATAFFDFTTTPVTIQEYPDIIKILLGTFGVGICMYGLKKLDDYGS